jgi:LruC domain-containing protein
MNTLSGQSHISAAQVRIVMHFKTPLRDEELGTPPFEPFLIVDGERSREVHLIGHQPTDRGGAYVGQGDDVGSFRTANGLPWGIVLPESWAWPAEREPVDQVHLEFANWAESGGTVYTDWYRNKGHNRNDLKVY